MNFWRALLASLLSLVCTLAVSAFVILQTLETTVLDRQEVKGWLDKSGIYNNLLNTFISASPAAQQEMQNGSSIISVDAQKAALNQTLNAAYMQQSTEKVLDSAYN